MVSCSCDDHLNGSPVSGDTDERVVYLVQTNVRLNEFGVTGEEIVVLEELIE